MRYSLSTWVLIAFIAGIATGVFGGAYCAPLQVVGEVYVGLLQMTVLPYIVASLITNLGWLDGSTCRRLAGAVAAVSGVLWLLIGLILLLLPRALPEWQAGSFFTHHMLQQPPQINFVDLFIPTNPFQSLAENVIPATVLFSICLGIAMIGIAEKRHLLDASQVVLTALLRVNHTVVQFSPIGVFAITAAAAGTISLEEFSRLQVYLAINFAGTLLTGLVILPLLVSATTSIGYFAFLRVAWAPMLTAFATGKTLVVLPMIAEGTGRLLRDAGIADSSGVKPDTLVALGYPIPHLGKLISLLFIPFAAWFVGSPLNWSDYPSFLAAGLLSMFGSPVGSIPFLLDLQHLPADLFQMFVASGVLCGRLGDLLGVVSLFAFTILTTTVLERKLQLQLTAIGWRAVLAIGLALFSVGALRSVLTPLVASLPSRDQEVLAMHSAVVPADDKELSLPLELESPAPGLSRLQRIRRRGALRVGCLVDNLPFSFRNGGGQLVGYDIDMAHLLASELDCQLWLVPVTPQQLMAELENDSFDLAMCGLIMTADRLQVATFTRPYMRVTMSLLVPDYRRHEFATLENIRRMERVRIAVLPSRRFRNELTRLFPQVELVTVSSPRDFFADSTHDADAMYISAEAGSAWTLMYPGFTTVVPDAHKHTLPLAYPIAAHDRAFADFVSQWIDAESTSAEFRTIYEYWILGRGTEAESPRWSIIRDVLGWVR